MILLARFVLYALIAVATVSVSRAADDASFPSRPIRIVVAKLRDGVVQAINAPGAKAAPEVQGARPIGNTPAELSAVIAADTARWGKVIRDADIKLAP